MTFDNLRKKLEEADIESVDLDDMVCDVMQRTATNINNQGIDIQLHCLLEWLSPQEILNQLT